MVRMHSWFFTWNKSVIMIIVKINIYTDALSTVWAFFLVFTMAKRALLQTIWSSNLSHTVVREKENAQRKKMIIYYHSPHLAGCCTPGVGEEKPPDMIKWNNKRKHTVDVSTWAC